jgi:hypothetical protein
MRLRRLAAIWIVLCAAVIVPLLYYLWPTGSVGAIVSGAGSLGIGAAFTYPLREWDKRTKLHSEEIGTLLAEPEVFLGGKPEIQSKYPSLLNQARDHLRAYPPINRVIIAYQSEDENRRNAEGVLKTYLLSTSTRILRDLYPGAVEWDMSGESPMQFILPGQLANDLALEFAQFSTTGNEAGWSVQASEQKGGWRVSRSGATTYAVVTSRAACKEEDLQARIASVIEGPELRRLNDPLQTANKEAWRLRGEAVAQIRELGDRVRHGHRLQGVCALGY